MYSSDFHSKFFFTKLLSLNSDPAHIRGTMPLTQNSKCIVGDVVTIGWRLNKSGTKNLDWTFTAFEFHTSNPPPRSAEWR